MEGNNEKNDLFKKDEYGEMIAPMENIIDYVELTHFIEQTKGEQKEILQCYALDKNGCWHNGYRSNPYNNPFFLSRWELSDWEIKEASEGQLQEYINKGNV